MRKMKGKLSTIISYLLIVCMLFSSLMVNTTTVSATDTETTEYQELELGVEQDIVFSEENRSVKYKFIPTISGCYKFYLAGVTENVYGWISDDEDSYIPIKHYVHELELGEYTEYYDLEAGKTYYYTVECYDDIIPAVSIRVDSVTGNATSITIANGTEISGYIYAYTELLLDFEPVGCIPPDVTWTSSNPEIVEVWGDGTRCYAYYNAPGTATVTATTTEGMSAAINITVEAYGELELGVEEEITLQQPGGEGVKYYQFTPEESEKYSFYAVSDAWGITAYIYDTEWNLIEYDDTSCFEDGLFSVSCDLESGTTYYFELYNDGSEEKTYSVILTEAIKATSISITNGTEISGYPREEKRLWVEFQPEGCVVEDVTWTSSDTSVATVSSDGWVYYVAPGTATIMATSESGLTATITVTVNEFPELKVGEQIPITTESSDDYIYYQFTPEEDGAYMISSTGYSDSYCRLYNSNWSSLKSDDDSGENNNFKLTCKLEGGETYYFRFNGYDSGANFNVMLKELTEPATAITVTTGTEIRGYVGEGKSVEVELSPEDCIPEELTWSSSDTSVVVIGQYGEKYAWVRYEAAGTATITVTSSSGLTAEIKVTVKEIPELELGVETSATIATNEYARYQFTPEEDGAYKFYSVNGNYNIYASLCDSNNSWLMDDYDTSGENGNFAISYHLEGGKTYYITVGNRTSQEVSYNIAVKKLTETATSISIKEGTSFSGYAGNSINITVGFLPADCIPQNVTWTSSDTSVATVSAYSGTQKASVYYSAPGTATITATTDQGLTTSVTVVVKEIPELELGVETAAVVESGEGTRFQFTPEKDGAYMFYSASVNGSLYCSLYNSHNNWMADDYNCSGGNGNFEVSYNLEGGETYYIRVGSRSSQTTAAYVAVKELTEPATSVTITNGTEISGYAGEEEYLTAELMPDDCIPQEITWASSDTSVATVSKTSNSKNSWVYFIAPGTATITATTTEGLTATVTVTVKEIPELKVGEQIPITLGSSDEYVYYQFTPEEDGAYMISSTGYNDPYCELLDSDWGMLTSNDDSGENNNFKLSYKFEGGETYYFRFACYNSGASFNVMMKELTEPATSITITNGTQISGYAGRSKNLSVELSPEDCIPQDVTWTSSDTSVATVSANNISGDEAWVRFGVPGTATITATTSEGLTATITVVVKEMQELALGVETATVMESNGETYYKFTPEEDGAYKFYSIGGDYDLNCSLYDSFNGWLAEDYNYSGGNGEFAVSYNLKGGNTYYIRTGTWSSQEVSYSIAVKELTEPATSITITNGTEISGYAGEEKSLTAVLTPEDCIPQDIIWTTSDETVATVYANGGSGKNAWVYFESPGTATITATTSEGLTATITVTVKEIQEIKVGDEISLTLDETGSNQYLKFIPEESRTYKFSLNGEYANITLLDEYFDHIVDGSSNVLTYNFEAGTTYYFRIYSWNEGTVTATIEEAVGIETLEIVSYPDHMEYYKDVDNYYSFTGLELKATFEDGTVVNWKYGDGNLNGYSVLLQKYYDEATQDGTRAVITCAGKSVEFSFILIDNPVDYIKIYSGEVPELVENVDGRENYEGTFIYDTDWIYDLQFEIVYLDGTTKIVEIYDDIAGYRIYSTENQWNEPWTLGADNYIKVTYAGHTLDIPVTIVENPVEKIVLNSAPTKEYIWGDYSYGGVYDEVYYFEPLDLTGLSFTVYYKDGTTKTYTDADIDEDGYCDGYEVRAYEVKCEAAGDATATLSYMGHKFEYIVKVKESGVSSIEVIKDPNVTTYEYWYEPDFIGMQIKITYTDGTSEIVEITEDNIQYYLYSEVFCSVDTGDSVIAIMYEDEESYRISYQGTEYVYNGITYTDSKEISSVEVDNASIEMVGMKVKVTYADGTVDNLTILEVLDYDEYDGMKDAYVRTENGIQYCSYEEGYGVYIFGRYDMFEEDTDFIVGDVNDDGEVNNLDRQVLTRYLANWDGYTADTLNLQAADVNGDGEVNNLDRQILTRHLANWEGYEELPYQTNPDTDSDNTDSDNTESDITIEEDEGAWSPFY